MQFIKVAIAIDNFKAAVAGQVDSSTMALLDQLSYNVEYLLFAEAFETAGDVIHAFDWDLDQPDELCDQFMAIYTAVSELKESDE